MDYRVREIDVEFYPEWYDEDLGWIGYVDEGGVFISYDNEIEAWEYITNNPR